MTEFIKVCPYCPRYKNCPYSEYIDATEPVTERKQKAAECLAAVQADKHYETMRENIDTFGATIPYELTAPFEPISPDENWELPF